MSRSCCSVASPSQALTARYRRALWMALAVNAAMLAIELGASRQAESVSLLADAIDFAGDAANYGLSLGALALGAAWQSRAAPIANVGVAGLLFAHRDGNANMRSVWLCSRNDAIGNAAVLAAAAGVFGTGSPLPDLAVATAMATLAISAGVSTVRQARCELMPVHAH